MSEKPLVKVRAHPPSGTIILNRPERRNALSQRAVGELSQALEDLRQERRVRAVILTGAGSAFCAGLDLVEMRETSRRSDAAEQWRAGVVAYKELLQRMMRHPKPIVAAVNGPALGAGAGLVLASDLVAAAPGATFGFPEPRYGLVSGAASPLLAFRIGGGPAARLLLSAEPIEAAEAHRVGLYHEIVKADLIWARAHELAAQCARSAPEAIQLTKRVLNETAAEHLEVQLSAGAAASAAARTTEAAAEGLEAFFAKRPPNWP